jgi:hypothetical protein
VVELRKAPQRRQQVLRRLAARQLARQRLGQLAQRDAVSPVWCTACGMRGAASASKCFSCACGNNCHPQPRAAAA